MTAKKSDDARRILTARELFRQQHSVQEVRQMIDEADLTQAWCKALRLDKEQRDLIWEHAKSVNHKRPMLADFHAVFDRFPLYLTVQIKPNIRDNAGLGQLLGAKDLAKIPIFRQYLKVLEVYADEIGSRPTAMLLNWPNAGPMVIHNAPAGAEVAPPHRSFRFAVDDDGSLRTLEVEPLRQFADRIFFS